MKPWMRTGLLEALGTFALVFFAAAAVCINTMTTPDGQRIDHSPQTAVQPGLIGVALAQGLILALLLELTAAAPGGYFNPAITIVLWVFNRLATRPMLGLIICQLAGALLAGGALLLIFSPDVARSARLGTPHLNAVANLESADRGAQVTGAGVELILTFFLVLAIFWAGKDHKPERTSGPRSVHHGPALAGGTLIACVLVGFPLTGAAMNPARYLGSAAWEATLARPPGASGSFADMFVYVAGPILGALAAAVFAFKLMEENN